MNERDDRTADPRTWLRFAESCLSLARLGHGRPGVLLEHLCFHTRQAAETALKALLVVRAVIVPKTHAIAAVIYRLRESGVVIPDGIEDAVDLTTYAVRTRYPGGPTVTEEDYQAAVQTADDVLTWVRRELSNSSP